MIIHDRRRLIGRPEHIKAPHGIRGAFLFGGWAMWLKPGGYEGWWVSWGGIGGLFFERHEVVHEQVEELAIFGDAIHEELTDFGEGEEAGLAFEFKGEEGGQANTPARGAGGRRGFRAG